MGAGSKIALRLLSEAEERSLQPIAKESLERMDVVKRAKALLAVAAGQSLTQAGQTSGLSHEGVWQLVERFNQRGLAVLVIAPVRGRKPTYGAQARAQVVQEVRCQPDRQRDQTATWSLKLLERVCRLSERPPLDASSMRKATSSFATIAGGDTIGVNLSQKYLNTSQQERRGPP